MINLIEDRQLNCYNNYNVLAQLQVNNKDV